MGILDKIKYGIDVPRWQMMTAIGTHAAGVSICADKRNDWSGYQAIFQLVSATVFNIYYVPQNSYGFIINPGISAFAAGATCTFVPSFTYVGTIGAGSSTTAVVTSTVIDSIPLNGFVIKEGVGAKVRIIGNSAGSSGLIEERMIIGNTAGTTPTLHLSSALTFTPANGDTYEISIGRVYFLGTTAGATQFRYYNIGGGTMNSAANTALTIAVDSNMICLDEQYVPYNRQPGEGFLVGSGTYDSTTKSCLTATASAAGTLTGQASGGDAGVIANEYRNFQIRIVEDTGTPTAVNQRRWIASHTGPGASPVYTLGANWTVTPSATAKFVIENPNQIILFAQAAGTAIYTYNYSNINMTNGTTAINTNTWSSTYYTARSNAVAAGTFTIPSWGHQPTTNTDGTRLSRHSYIYSFRGGATTLDRLDIAGGTNGAWSNALAYTGQGTSISTASGGDYAPIDNNGRRGYFVLNATGLVFSFDVENLSVFPWAFLPGQAGTAVVGNRLVVTPTNNVVTQDDPMSLIFVLTHLSGVLYRSEVII